MHFSASGLVRFLLGRLGTQRMTGDCRRRLREGVALRAFVKACGLRNSQAFYVGSDGGNLVYYWDMKMWMESAWWCKSDLETRT